VNAATVTRCRSCGSSRLDRVLDLGEQPASDLFPLVTDPTPDQRWPLGLVLCDDCTLLQLSHVSPVPEAPLAVESRTMVQHAADVSGRVMARLASAGASTVREFDSHHGGSWLEHLTSRGLTPTSGDGLADLVVDNHSIIHEEDVEDALAARVRALAPSGHLVIEFHHALRLVDGAQFDTVRHGHPVYLSLTAWSVALRRHGLTVLDVWEEPVYGGCLVAVAARTGTPAPTVAAVLAAERAAGLCDRQGFSSLADLVTEVAGGVRQHLQDAADAGRLVLGYGAPSKAAVLLGVSGVDAGLLPATADISPAKWGRRVPGAGTPIVSPDELVAARPDEVLVLTWDIADEVVDQLAALREAGCRFVVPIPHVHVVA
jgi:hypothetical protein